jgi:hypothetical protein
MELKDEDRSDSAAHSEPEKCRRSLAPSLTSRTHRAKAAAVFELPARRRSGKEDLARLVGSIAAQTVAALDRIPAVRESLTGAPGLRTPVLVPGLDSKQRHRGLQFAAHRRRLTS